MSFVEKKKKLNTISLPKLSYWHVTTSG
jgi:hypothetical protein